MLKLNRMLYKFSRPICRQLSTEVEEQTTVSSRQRTWATTEQRYRNYEHIIYSSHLEMQEEHMSYGLKRSLVNKIKRDKKRRQIEMANSGVSDIPKGWMDEYEYYSGTQNENGTEPANANILGSADPTVQPSNVPCNGCGAHLHCNHHTRPGLYEMFLCNTLFNIFLFRIHPSGNL